jgi:hypothetical protein
MDTASSRTVNRNNPPNTTAIRVADKLKTGVEIKTNNRCPAIILAASRIPKVKGRIIFLNSSIKTINGTRTIGVPLGTRWAKKRLGVNKNAGRIKLNHNALLTVRVKLMCLLAVNTYGKRPKKLLLKTKINTPENSKGALLPNTDPLLTSNSWLRVEYSLDKANLNRDLRTPQAEGRITTAAIAAQFKLNVKTPILGSKQENSLLINIKCTCAPSLFSLGVILFPCR